MTSRDKKSIPVFIFLDAGVPNISKDIENWKGFANYNLLPIPFPESFRSVSVPDHQVALFIKDKIFSKSDFICGYLSHPLSPHFVFFTSDSKFIEDAKAELRSQSKLRRGIKFNHHCIKMSMVSFKKISVRVIYVHGESHDRRPGLVEKMRLALLKYLDET